MEQTAKPKSIFSAYTNLVRENANFRNLWIGQIVSLLGDWFNLIASASLIGQLTGSGVAIGGLFVVRMLAPFLISPFAGAWADRYNRRTILIITDITRAITVLFFLVVREPQQVWLLYTLTAVQLGISGVFFPTRNAILPDLVSKNDIGTANALSSATWSVMLSLGAALGGLAAGTWGVYPAFIIDAFTFIVSAIFVSRIRYQPVSEPDQADRRRGFLDIFTQYFEGLRYIRQNRFILFTVLLKASAGLAFSGAFQVIQVTIAEQYFVIGEGGGISLGLIYTMVGIGTGLGPIIARRFTSDGERELKIAIIFAFVMVSIGFGLISTMEYFIVVLIGVMLRGIGSGINWVFSTQILLQSVPNQVRGRVFSTEFALFTLANAIGAAAGGWAIDNLSIGISGIIWRLAFLALVPGLLWGLSLVIQNRERSVPWR